MTPVSQNDSIRLYTYFRSSCSARLRIALALKQLPVTYEFINLLAAEQKGADYVATVNPSGSVPTLEVVDAASGSVKLRIGQSLAALEFLEEAFPETRRLLPSAAAPRALVRSLCQVIGADTQPVTNLRILQRVRAVGADAEAWARDLVTQGLMAYEALIQASAGRYSVGDEVTMADCCLVPAVWGAQRVGVDFAQLQTLWGVFERLSRLEEVERSHWKTQPDTPVELRG